MISWLIILPNPEIVFWPSCFLPFSAFLSFLQPFVQAWHPMRCISFHICMSAFVVPVQILFRLPRYGDIIGIVSMTFLGLWSHSQHSFPLALKIFLPCFLSLGYRSCVVNRSPRNEHPQSLISFFLIGCYFLYYFLSVSEKILCDESYTDLWVEA